MNFDLNVTTFLNTFLRLLLSHFSLIEKMLYIVSIFFCRNRRRMNISWSMSSVLFIGCLVVGKVEVS